MPEIRLPRWRLSLRRKPQPVGTRRRSLRSLVAFWWGQLPWNQPRHTITEKNIWNLYAEIAWFGVLNGIATTFISVFAVRLGATTTQVGLLSALPALVNILWLLPSARIIERERRRLPLILWAGFWQRFSYLLIALMPLVFATGQVQVLIALVALITLPTALINVAITSLIAEVVPVQERARVVSTRQALVYGVSTVAGLVGGWALDLMPFPLNYQVVFGVGTLASALSLVYLRRIRLPEEVVARQSRPQSAIPKQLGLIGTHHHDFVRFVLSLLLYNAGLYLPAPLYALYRVRNLAASDTWIGALAMVLNAMTIISYLYWGRQTPRLGHRKILLLGATGLVLFPTLTASFLRIEPQLIVSLIGGVFGAAFELASFNLLLEVCPSERRPTYIAIYTAFTNVMAFLGPLTGSALAEWLGIRTALFIAGGTRLAGVGVLFWLLPGAPGDSQTANKNN